MPSAEIHKHKSFDDFYFFFEEIKVSLCKCFRFCMQTERGSIQCSNLNLKHNNSKASVTGITSTLTIILLFCMFVF